MSNAIFLWIITKRFSLAMNEQNLSRVNFLQYCHFICLFIYAFGNTDAWSNFFFAYGLPLLQFYSGTAIAEMESKRWHCVHFESEKAFDIEILKLGDGRGWFVLVNAPDRPGDFLGHLAVASGDRGSQTTLLDVEGARYDDTLCARLSRVVGGMVYLSNNLGQGNYAIEDWMETVIAQKLREMTRTNEE